MKSVEKLCRLSPFEKKKETEVLIEIFCNLQLFFLIFSRRVICLEKKPLQKKSLKGVSFKTESFFSCFLSF